LNNLGLNKLQQKAKDTHRKIRIEVCRGKRRGKSHATNGDIEALVTRRVLKNVLQKTLRGAQIAYKACCQNFKIIS
jgi:hypothetical protein